MDLKKILKENSGSTLTMVLFMLFLLSVTAIAVITVTGSELSLSVMNSDKSKALMAAQAGAEAAAQIIDEQVAQVQEDSRTAASVSLKNGVNGFVSTDIEDNGSIFYNVIKHSDGTVLDDERLNEIFKSYYLAEFYSRITAWINTQASTNWKSDQMYNANKIDNSGGTYSYQSVGLISNSGSTSGVKLVSTGNYNKIKRNIEIELSFLTDAGSGGTQQVPVSYGKLTKVRINKNNKPDLMSKAIIAMKNIISVDGTATIDGDIICFGTIARDGADSRKENFEATGYSYGGIMAGVISNIWDDTSIGPNLKNNEVLKRRLNLNESFFGDKAGSFMVNGNVATMSYVHSLYGTYDIATNKYYKSDITVSGDLYARAVSLENNSHFSSFQLNKVYLTDDLIVNSSDSLVKIGEWNSRNVPNRSKQGKLVGLEKGIAADSTRTSAVVIGGDSELWLNGSIFVGGSTSFNELTKLVAPYNSYISGISVLKSGSQPSDAFRVFPEEQLIDGNFPNNTFYLYDNLSNSYKTVNESSITHKLQKETYNFTSPLITPSAVYMMEGALNSGTQIKYNIFDKGMHFKKIWDDFWKDSKGYSSTINTDEIIITTNTQSKLEGWCGGAVAANDTIYGPFGGFSETYTEYTSEVASASSNYRNILKSFFNNPAFDLKSIDPEKRLSDSLEVSALADGAIYITQSTVFAYRASQDIIVSPQALYNVNNGSSGAISKDSDGYIRGVVYSSGDIYITEGTKFKGILIAGGNIVFLGDSTIKYDEDTLDLLLSEKPLEVTKFFKYSPRDTVLNDSTISTVRLANVKNIKIKSWKEVSL